MSQHRHRVRLAILLIALSATTACTALKNFNNPQSVSWYSLNDRLSKPESAQSPVDKVVIVEPVRANPFYDSTKLAFSRSDIARAYYQFAVWTERPAKRLGKLVERRLAASNKFATVAASTVGLRGDLSLNLTLDELLHDTVPLIEQARIVITAELVDRRQRILVARKKFVFSAPIDSPSASNAVRAMSDALTELLNQLTTWTATHARNAPDKKSGAESG